MRSFLWNKFCWRIISTRTWNLLVMIVLLSSHHSILGSWVINLRWIHARTRIWVLSTQWSSRFSSYFVLRLMLKHGWWIWIISPSARSTLFVFIHLSCFCSRSKTISWWLKLISQSRLISSRPRCISASRWSWIWSSRHKQPSRSCSFSWMSLNVIISRSRNPTSSRPVSPTGSKSKSRCCLFCKPCCRSILARTRRIILHLLISIFSSKTFAWLSVDSTWGVVGSRPGYILTKVVFVSSTQRPSSFWKTWLMLVSSRARSLFLCSKIKFCFQS